MTKQTVQKLIDQICKHIDADSKYSDSEKAIAKKVQEALKK